MTEGLVTLNWGPQHPVTGHFRMIMTIDGDLCVEAEPTIGYTHRGIEKLLENRQFLVGIPMIERSNMTDTAPMSLSYTKAVESLMDFEAPPRAQYLRTIISEICRLSSHLYNLSLYTIALGMYTPFMWAIGDREHFLKLGEMLSGVRLAYNYSIPGGVYRDMPTDFPHQATKTMNYFKNRLKEYKKFIYDTTAVKSRGEDVGIMSKEEALKWGVTGPVLRGSGVKKDMRKVEPYGAYSEIDFEVITKNEGDSHARMLVRYEEMEQSLSILEQCIKNMPNGDYFTKVRPAVPAGETFTRVEAARGEIGVYLFNKETRTMPYRTKFSNPSFKNGYVLPKLFVGSVIADCAAIYHSIDVWALEMDR